MIYQRSFWLCILSSLLMVGCKHGCTFTTVVKKISKKEKVGEANILVEVALLKKRNVRFTKSDHQFHTSDRGYSVAIHLKADTQRINLHWAFPAEKGEDLKPYLNNVEIEAAAKNDYFLVSYTADRRVQLYQRFENKWLNSIFYNDFLAGKYNLNNLPSEAAFIDSLIFNETLFLRLAEQSYVGDVIVQKNLSEHQIKGLMQALDKHNNKLAIAYFSTSNIQKIGQKYPEIKQVFLKKAMTVILDKQYRSNAIDTYKKVLLAYGTKNDFLKVDKMIIEEWKQTWSDKHDAYVKARLFNQKQPINQTLLDAISKEARQCIDKTIAGDKDYDKYHYKKKYIYPERASAFLFWVKDKAYQQKMVDYYLSSAAKQDKFKLKELIDTEFSSLNPELKSRVINFAKTEFEKTLAEDSPFNAANWYNFLDGKVACPELKELNEKYIDGGKSAVFLDKKKPDC